MPIAQGGLSVADLVARGRYPRKGWIRRQAGRDDEVIQRVLTATDMVELSDRCVDELSGRLSHRVWIAMALARETDILLVDQPITELDLAQ